MKLLFLAFGQSILLCGSQTLLKIAMSRIGAFEWSGRFFAQLFTNWWLLGAGLGFACSAVLWMYILRHFPFSHAYPLISMAYAIGMFVAIFVFHETVHWQQWLGVFLIISGCCFIAQ